MRKNQLWGGIALCWISLSTPAEAVKPLGDCFRLVTHAIRFLRLPALVEASDAGAESSLEALEPEFAFVRHGLRLGLIETQSQVRLFLQEGNLVAEAAAALDKQQVLTKDVPLTSEEDFLLYRIFRDRTVANLDEDERRMMRVLFYEKVCPLLFAKTYENLRLNQSSLAATSLASYGVNTWVLEDAAGPVGYQIEGWTDEQGRVANSGSAEQSFRNRSLLQVLFEKGIIEIRAFDTQSNTTGYCFIRRPLADLGWQQGDLKSLVRLVLGQYRQILAEGAKVNGSRFPFHHGQVSRAAEIGLDPSNDYLPLDYIGRPLRIIRGSFEGKTAEAVRQTEAVRSAEGGIRSELTLRIEGVTGLTLSLPNAYVMPEKSDYDSLLAHNEIARGIDPETKEPFSLRVEEEVKLRNAGESARVVKQADPVENEPVRYEVIYLTGPFKDCTDIYSISELIPLRFLEAPRSESDSGLKSK